METNNDPYPVVRRHLADAELDVPDDALDLLALRISADVEIRTPRRELTESDVSVDLSRISEILDRIRQNLEWRLLQRRLRGDQP